MDLSQYNLKTFTIDGTKSEAYGEAVKKTAQLLKRPYFQMHTLFTKERWTLEEINRYYSLATKHNGKCASEIVWWANRKRRNGDK